MKRILPLAILLFLVFQSCQHQIINQPGTNPNDTVPVNNGGSSTKSDTVCYSSEIQPLFITYCAMTGCHDAISRKDGINLTTYATVMKGIVPFKPSNSKYYTEIGRGMPPAGYAQMNSTQLALISKWITQGALNTVCVNACDTTKFAFADPISTLLTNNCNGCHGTKPGSGNVYLGDYASAKAYISANQTAFLNAINHTSAVVAKRMPPGNKMADCQIGQFTKWINKGFPQ